METTAARFFLGANSPRGFVSFYDQLIDLREARDVFILKGGPGCGKSSFMRRVASKLQEAGYLREDILCSSDPDSLDGVVFPQLKLAMVDGTSPHVVECRYPAAVESIVNLGVYYDREALKEKKQAIMDIMAANRLCYDRAYRCLSAARHLREDISALTLPAADLKKLSRRAQGIIAREFRGKTGSGKTKKRFLSGLTPKGAVCLFDTVRALCPRVYVLSDSFGLSTALLLPILEAAQQRGLETVACYCPQDPEHRLEHLLFPELGLAFVTSTTLNPWEGAYYRHIRLDPVVDAAVLQEHRTRLRFEKKMSEDLVDQAIVSLRRAKELHDRLEEVYNPHVDFEGVYSLADRTTREILSHAQ